MKYFKVFLKFLYDKPTVDFLCCSLQYKRGVIYETGLISGLSFKKVCNSISFHPPFTMQLVTETVSRESRETQLTAEMLINARKIPLKKADVEFLI